MRLKLEPITNANAYELCQVDPIPESDRTRVTRINPLDAETLWSTIVHPDPEKFYVRRQLGHWTNESAENWMGWYESANDLTIPDDVSSKLKGIAKWSGTDEIFFMHNRWTTYRTSWSTFLRYWRQFLRMNNYPIILKPCDPMFFYFGSTGNIAWGWRPVHNVETTLEWIFPETAPSGS